MGGWDEETYYAKYPDRRVNGAAGVPWPDVQDAYLRAWEFRPTRAEPLHAIAYRYRTDQRYWLGYLFAERAAAIPLPDEDTLFVGADVYAWRAVDEQAVCASWIGKHTESFTLCRQLLARPRHPRRRSERGSRETATFRRTGDDRCGVVVPGRGGAQPGRGSARRRGHRQPGRRAGSRVPPSRRSIHSCTPASTCRGSAASSWSMPACQRRIARHSLERYRFLEFGRFRSGGWARRASSRRSAPRSADGSGCISDQGWRFFAPEHLIGRLTAVLQAEPEVFQVANQLR